MFRLLTYSSKLTQGPIRAQKEDDELWTRRSTWLLMAIRMFSVISDMLPGDFGPGYWEGISHAVVCMTVPVILSMVYTWRQGNKIIESKKDPSQMLGDDYLHELLDYEIILVCFAELQKLKKLLKEEDGPTDEIVARQLQVARLMDSKLAKLNPIVAGATKETIDTYQAVAAQAAAPAEKAPISEAKKSVSVNAKGPRRRKG